MTPRCRPQGETPVLCDLPGTEQATCFGCYLLVSTVYSLDIIEHLLFTKCCARASEADETITGPIFRQLTALGDTGLEHLGPLTASVFSLQRSAGSSSPEAGEGKEVSRT